MIRFIPVLALIVLTGCYGTLDLDDEESFDSTQAVTTGGAQDSPADTTTPATAPTTTEAPTDTATPEPDPEPSMEPDPEPEETLPEPGSVVVFEIAQGTGTGAWNSPDNPVVVYVGQVLRVTNFDDRDHRMHATDNAPIPHGGQLRPGQSEDYVVDAPLEVGDSAEAWDHNDGRSAPFWIEAREFPDP